MLASLTDKQFNKFVTPSCEQKGLLVGCHSVETFFTQFFEGVDFGLAGEFGLQELGLHEFLGLLAFDEEHGFDDVVVGEEPVDRSLLIDLPYTHTLVIRAAGHEFIITANDYISNPLLVTVIGSSIKTCADFPQFYSLVSGTTNQVIAIHYKVNITYIMVVSMESFATNEIVIQVP